MAMMTAIRADFGESCVELFVSFHFFFELLELRVTLFAFHDFAGKIRALESITHLLWLKPEHIKKF